MERDEMEKRGVYVIIENKKVSESVIMLDANFWIPETAAPHDQLALFGSIIIALKAMTKDLEKKLDVFKKNSGVELDLGTFERGRPGSPDPEISSMIQDVVKDMPDHPRELMAKIQNMSSEEKEQFVKDTIQFIRNQVRGC